MLSREQTRGTWQRLRAYGEALEARGLTPTHRLLEMMARLDARIRAGGTRPSIARLAELVHRLIEPGPLN